jgi:hypothetical protein
MGNYTTKSKEEWVQDNMDTIKLKFNNAEILDEKDISINWNIISNYLEILYDIKYNGYKITKDELGQFRMNPEELECYI